MDFLKGMCAGLMVGACVGMAVAPKKKCGKRQLGRAVRAVSQVIEDIGDAVRF